MARIQLESSALLVDVDVSPPDNSGASVLDWAAAHGYWQVARDTLKGAFKWKQFGSVLESHLTNAPSDLLELTDATGQTVLMWAASCRPMHLVEQIIKAGANLHSKDADGQTALSLAVDSWRACAATTVAQSGMNEKRAKDECDTSVLHLSTVKLLLASGADRGSAGAILDLALQCGDAELVQKLIDPSMVIDTVYPDVQFSLDAALTSDHASQFEAVMALAQPHASVGSPSKYDGSIIKQAVKANNTGVLDAILQIMPRPPAGVEEPLAMSLEKLTEIFELASARGVEALLKLFEFYADTPRCRKTELPLCHKTEFLDRCLTDALSKNHVAVAEMLLQRGARVGRGLPNGLPLDGAPSVMAYVVLIDQLASKLSSIDDIVASGVQVELARQILKCGVKGIATGERKPMFVPEHALHATSVLPTTVPAPCSPQDSDLLCTDAIQPIVNVLALLMTGKHQRSVIKAAQDARPGGLLRGVLTCMPPHNIECVHICVRVCAWCRTWHTCSLSQCSPRASRYITQAKNFRSCLK
jgi:hypothetical protein